MIRIERSVLVEILEGVLKSVKNAPDDFVVEAPSFEDACLMVLSQHPELSVSKWLSHELIELIAPEEVNNG